MQPSDALDRYIDRLVVEGPYIDRGLCVFTLSTRTEESPISFLTLDEGIPAGQIIVLEKPGGSVPTLTVRNASGRWAFAMSGEIVAGGKQNRMLRSDAVIPPGGAFDLPVFCVEQHRWGAEGKFDSAKAATPNAMRSGASQGYDQGAVWRESERAQAEAGVRSDTGDVTMVYRDPKLAREVDEATRRIIGCIPRRAYVGLVIARGGLIVSADIFANGPLYERLHEKVIRSHVVECLRKTYPGAPTTDGVREFLSRAHGASRSVRPAPGGVGSIVSVAGNGLGGEWLMHDGRCIHAALFPQIPRPVPLPRPRYEE